MSPSADSLFAEFRETGSPRALAQVFDLLAPQLLLLAGHLVRDAAAAEDLVQATFLDAIEVAARFDPQRGSVQRWLVGILVNNARKELRRRGRALDLARIGPEPAGHPQAEAAAQEFLQTVERALAELPPHYREVLRLGLLHGLDQGEIAASLDRPRETVKTQFRRGVDRLRELLPKGFALSVALAFTMGRGMAGVRAAVLRRVDGPPLPLDHSAPARALRTTGATSGLRSTLLLPLCLVGVGLTVVAASAWWLWPRPAAERASVAARPGRAPAPPGPTALRDPVPDPPEAPGPGSLTVHVVWARDLAPASIGVRVRPARDLSWERELWLTANAAGRVVFQPPTQGLWRVRGDRGGEATVEVNPARANAVELRVPSGLLVEGALVDAARQPVAGAEVWLAVHEGSLDECSRVATTDTQGRFRLQDVDATLLIGVRAEQWVAPQAQALVDDGRGRCLVGFEVARPGRGVDGLVLGVDGRPAAEALVLAGHGVRSEELERPLRIPWRLRTGVDGRFHLPGVPPDTALALWVRGAGSAVDRGYYSTADARGAPMVRLVAGTEVHGILRGPAGDPAAGAEVALVDFAAERMVQQGYVFPRWMRLVATAEPDGRYTLPHVPSGEVELAAHHDQGLARHRVVLAGERDLVWDGLLEAPADLRMLVSDEQGQPLPGFVVEVRTMERDQLLWRGRANDRGGLRCPNIRRDPYQLVALDPVSAVGASVPAARLGPVMAGPEIHRVVVPATGRASAFVTLRPRAPSGSVLREALVRFALIEQRSVRLGEVPVAWAADQLRLGPFPAGRWQFVVGALGLGSQLLDPVDLATGETRALGDVQFQEPGLLEVELLPAPGQAIADKVLTVARPKAPLVAETLTLDHGRGTLRLQPGRYFLSPWNAELPMSYQELTVEAGGHLRCELRAPRVVPLTVEWPEVREPCLYVDLACFDSSGRQVLRMPGTRRPGMPTRLAYAAEPGRYTLVARDLLGQEQRQEFTVPGPDGAPALVRVPVPGLR